MNRGTDAPRREHRFSVFGRPIAVVGSERGWTAFHLGADGKRRRAEIAIPRSIPASGLAQYLADVCHEAATPRHPDVLPLP